MSSSFGRAFGCCILLAVSYVACVGLLGQILGSRRSLSTPSSSAGFLSRRLSSLGEELNITTVGNVSAPVGTSFATTSIVNTDELIGVSLQIARSAPQACEDTGNGASDPYGDTCADYVGNPEWCGNYDDDDFTSSHMCCVCGGGQTPPEVCTNTDRGATDPYGDSCADYVGNPEWCGNYDDRDFTSSQMCCICGGGEMSATPAPTISAPAQMELEHFDLLNKLRAQGFTCPSGQQFPPISVPLKFDCRLWRASQLHSQDMADSNYFSHTSQDGRSPWDRANAQGIRAGGENIAAGRAGASAVLEQWKKSDGHCKNMMSPHFKTFAVGYGFNSQATYRHYWTQMFAQAGDTNELCLRGGLSNQRLQSYDMQELSSYDVNATGDVPLVEALNLHPRLRLI